MIRDPLPAKLAPFIDKMNSQDNPTGQPIHPLVMNQFCEWFKQLESDQSTFISADQLTGISENDEYCVSYDTLSEYAKLGQTLLDQTIVLKLNGGLGTTLGSKGAKSALVVDPDTNRTFLDIIFNQIQTLNKQHQVSIPLWFLNSYNTQADTKHALGDRPYFELLQNLFPRIDNSDPDHRHPFEWKQNPKEEWNPPGHGDVFLTMKLADWTAKQLSTGFEYVFISNSDNLGATLDPAILGYMHQNKIDCLIETTPKTKQDIKGGSLIATENGIELVEIAQIDPDDVTTVEAFEKLPIFNTNSIWIRIRALESLLRSNRLKTKLICNQKQVGGVPVIQLESAMGSVVGCFETVSTVVVDRKRFMPVKNKADLDRVRASLRDLL